jgi:hypothetical protein
MNGGDVSVQIRANRVPQLPLMAAIFLLAPVLGLLVARARSGSIDTAFWGGVLLALVVEGFAAFMAYMACWSMFGLESMYIREGRLVVKRQLFRRTISAATYELHDIRNLRIDPVSGFRLYIKYSHTAYGRMGFGVGPVVFDYLGVEVRLAEGLRNDLSSAQRLLDMLRAAQERATAPGSNPVVGVWSVQVTVRLGLRGWRVDGGSWNPGDSIAG